MAITVPASDAAGTANAALIAAIVTQQSAAPFNVAGSSWANDAAVRLDKAQREQVHYLLAYGKLKAATILANETYGT